MKSLHAIASPFLPSFIPPSLRALNHYLLSTQAFQTQLIRDLVHLMGIYPFGDSAISRYVSSSLWGQTQWQSQESFWFFISRGYSNKLSQNFWYFRKSAILYFFFFSSQFRNKCLDRPKEKIPGKKCNDSILLLLAWHNVGYIGRFISISFPRSLYQIDSTSILKSLRPMKSRPIKRQFQ